MVLDGVRAAGRQARSLRRVEHRPWPPPEGRWALGQTVEDLLLAHWRVRPEELRDRVPAGLELELRDGSAWLGVVAFRASAVRARGALPLPGASSFLQLNVRTYVRAADGRPGVWFLSLDVSSRLAAAAARRAYRLPFFHARITLDRHDGWLDYECARLGERGTVFSGRCRAAGDAVRAEPGSLDWFLAERYCLYAAGPAGALHRAEVHHDPWPLQPAEAEIELTSIVPLALRGDPVCHLVRRQDLLVWPPERLPAAT